MANTIKEKELKTDWPSETGLTAGTTKTSNRQINLIAEQGSLVAKRKRKGMMN